MMNSRCLAWSFSEGYMMALFRGAGKTSEFFSFHYSFFGVLHDLHRFIVRDFTFSEDEITKQQREFEVAGTTEKELWVRTTPLTLTHSSWLCFEIDWTPSTGPHKLFRILPNPRPSQNHPSLRRKRTPIRSTFRIPRYRSQGKIQELFFFSSKSHQAPPMLFIARDKVC